MKAAGKPRLSGDRAETASVSLSNICTKTFSRLKINQRADTEVGSPGRVPGRKGVFRAKGYCFS
ncbi:MAG: hypothetical protein ACD_75C01780G0001, partial [uncultured bacterium]